MFFRILITLAFIDAGQLSEGTINVGADEAADSCVYAARYFTVHAAALTARIQHTSSDSRTINVFS